MFKDWADMAIEDTAEIIDFTREQIKCEHQVGDVFLRMDHVITHLADEIEERRIVDLALHDFIQTIFDFWSEKAFVALRDGIVANIHIIREETEILHKLEHDLEHRRWRYVLRDEKAADRDILHSIRETQRLIQFFERFMNLIHHGPSAFRDRIRETDLGEDSVFRYLTYLYRMARIYYHVFQELLEKEKRVRRTGIRIARLAKRAIRIEPAFS